MAEAQARQVEETRGSGIYPATGPFPSGEAPVRAAGKLGHPEGVDGIAPTIESLETAALVAARGIFGGFFLYNGINHFLQRKMMTEFARAKGVRAPAAAVLVTGAMMLAGGASLLFGVRPKVGAGLISGFLLGVSPVMHAFWKDTDPQQRMHDMVDFTKNMALVGASLFAAAHPEPWAWRASGSDGAGEALMPLR